MRRYVSYALIAVALLTVGVWAVSQFVQPVLPASINAGLFLFIAALAGVIGVLGQFKDIVELFRSFGEPPSKSPSTITGPVQVVFGNVTVNVTYIVQNIPAEAVGISTIIAQANKKPIPRQAPSLPSGFTGRAGEIAVLKQALLQRSQIVGLVGLAGMGGVGKTALAAALARAPDIEREFSDGTLWVQASSVKDVGEILSQWIVALNPSEPPTDPSNISQLIDRFRTLTKNRRLLIVFDGLDENLALQIQPIIQALGPMCRVLITSRRVNLPGVQTILSLDVLPENESLTLLEKEIGRKFTPQERAVAREIVFLAGYHPLALRLAGAFIRTTGIGLDEYREKLRVEVGRTRTLDEAREFSVSNICKTLDYVYNRLSLQERNKLRQLSVFATESFDSKAASDMWGVEISEAENLLSKFVATAFLNLKDGFYRMHPLVYEYLKGLLTS